MFEVKILIICQSVSVSICESVDVFHSISVSAPASCVLVLESLLLGSLDQCSSTLFPHI